MKYFFFKFLKFYFFQYLKNSYKIQTTFHQYQKLHSTPPPPWLDAHTCKRKYIYAFSSYSAKTKRDGQTDRQTDGEGALQYLPSRAFGAAGDNKRAQLPTSFSYMVQIVIFLHFWLFGSLWGGGAFNMFNDQTGPILLSSYTLTRIYVHVQ